MTTNQKILIALGLGAVAFYIYKMRGNRGQGAVTQPQAQAESGGMQSNSNPYLIGGGIGAGIKLPSREPSVIPSNRVFSNLYGGMMDSKEEVLAFESAAMKKYSVGGKPTLGDTLTTQFGVYKFTAPESRGNGLQAIQTVYRPNRWEKK
jgi:hypothetical protein